MTLLLIYFYYQALLRLHLLLFPNKLEKSLVNPITYVIKILVLSFNLQY